MFNMSCLLVVLDLDCPLNVVLNQLIDMNDVEWTKGLIQQLLSKFNPLIETMAEAVDEQLKGIQNQDKVPDKTEQQKNSQFKQDQTKIQDIIKKYNIR